jgi:hypothetical protein
MANVGVEGAGTRHVPGHRGEPDREQDQDRRAHHVRRRIGGAVARGDADGEGACDDGERGGGCHHHEHDGGRTEPTRQSVVLRRRRLGEYSVSCHDIDFP